MNELNYLGITIKVKEVNILFGKIQMENQLLDKQNTHQSLSESSSKRGIKEISNIGFNQISTLVVLL